MENVSSITEPAARSGFPSAPALQRQWRNWLPFGLLVFFTLFTQISAWRAAEPMVFGDSSGYETLALKILEGDWSGFFFRTPGYPVFLALSYLVGGKSYDAVIALQFLMGSFTPILLYAIYGALTRNNWLRALAAAAFLLDRYSVGIQCNILTEPLAQFFIVASLAAYLSAVKRAQYWTAPLVGVVLFMALMVRPVLQLLPLCIAVGGIVVTVFHPRSFLRRRRAIAWHLAVLAVAQILCWLWSAKIQHDYGHFAISLQFGASMTNQTGKIMEKAPESTGPLRDAYLEIRREQGNHINVIEKVWKPLEQQAGMTPWQVSLAYQPINKYLILHNPGWYAVSVAHSWQKLWTESAVFYIEPGPYHEFSRHHWFFGPLYKGMDKLYWCWGWLLWITPYLYLTLVTAMIVLWWRDALAVLTLSICAGAVVYNMLLTAMVQNTEFGRYRMPIQPLYLSLFLFAAGLVITKAWSQLRRRDNRLA